MRNQEDLKHVCIRCFKKFRCGKSLGGHMRSHVMAAKAAMKKSKEAVKHDNNEEKQDDNGVELSKETPKQQEDNNVAMEVQSGTEIDEEMIEAARSIMELSRDSFNLAAESSNGLQNKTAATTESKKVKINVNSKLKKVKGHKCPYCDRAFKSGQALGGHKRSHLMGGGSVGTIDKEWEQTPQPQELQPQSQSPSPQQPQTPSPQQQPQQQLRQPLLIDLNLPSIMEEEDCGNS
ncbi:unnamed protein product [Amaranthus hypochondriacus]